MLHVCFVCLGNICRSPTAEAVMRHLLLARGLEGEIEVDSAGTSAAHAGEPPDRRSAQAARQRGIVLGGRARQFELSDFDAFDYVVAMDVDNFEQLRQWAPSEAARGRVSLLRDFDALSPAGSSVPDPYYGGRHGFDEVIDLCQRGCAGLLQIMTERSSGTRNDAD